jgi:hypothetical protein
MYHFGVFYILPVVVLWIYGMWNKWMNNTWLNQEPLVQRPNNQIAIVAKNHSSVI